MAMGANKTSTVFSPCADDNSACVFSWVAKGTVDVVDAGNGNQTQTLHKRVWWERYDCRFAP